MNSVARSLCEYLSSRNNDIAGYYGIGVLCRIAKREGKMRMHFRIRPGEKILIHGYEVTDSLEVTEKLVAHRLDMIEGRISFFPDGRYPNGVDKYTCGMAMAVTQGGRTGLFICHTACWPHDPTLERRRAGAEAVARSILDGLKSIWEQARPSSPP